MSINWNSFQHMNKVKAGSVDTMFSWLYNPWPTLIQNDCWGVELDNLTCLSQETIDTSSTWIFPLTWLLDCLTWFFIKFKIAQLDILMIKVLMTMSDPCWTSNSLNGDFGTMQLVPRTNIWWEWNLWDFFFANERLTVFDQVLITETKWWSVKSQKQKWNGG